MKRITSALTASLLASALIASPVLAKDGNNGNDNGNGNGAASSGGHGNGAANSNSNSAAEFAPSRTENVPGQVKGEDESAREYAPGQLKNGEVDEDTTASTGRPNFGTVISSIRAGKSNLDGLDTDPEVHVIDVEDRGGSRAALDNALEDNNDVISDLQTALLALELDDLSEDDARAAVAAQVGDDGSLTVFVDR